jgi:hypothetical protein
MKNKYQFQARMRALPACLSGAAGKTAWRALVAGGVLGMLPLASAQAFAAAPPALPQINCINNIVVNNDAGTCGAQVTYTAPQGTQAGQAIRTELMAGLASGAVFPLGATIVTYRATDDVGNSTACSFVVTVLDNETPTIAPPAPVVVYTAPGRCSASGIVLGSPIVGDNCTGLTITNNAPVSGTKGSTVVNYPIGTTTITWTVTDHSGNTATATQTVSVLDNEAPSITAPTAVVVNTDPGQATASHVTLGTATAGDNCTGVVVSNDAPVSFPVGTTTVTWTATDVAGNISTATQLVVVADHQNPTLVAPANLNLDTNPGECLASHVLLGSATASDNVPGVVVTNNAPSSFAQGNTLVIWTATDAAGNTTTATQQVRVTDHENPVVSAPADVTVTADPGQTSASGLVLGTATAGDNCTGVVVSNDAPATFPAGITTVTWTATDAAGNTTSAAQQVIVELSDTEAPILTAPANVVVGTDTGLCLATGVSLGMATATDSTPGVVITNDAPVTYAKGTTTVTWTAADAMGNVATATQTVTVIDRQAPIINVPAAVTASANAGQCSASGVVLGAATASDNCSSATVTNNAPTSFPVGTTTVTWTATDAAGNSATATQTVTVVDRQSPTLVAPANVTWSTNPGQCLASGVALGTATAGDNCAGVVVTNNAPATYAKGTTTVTWTATDAAGNVATATQHVTIVDNEQPRLQLPAAIVQSASATQCAAVVSFAATATDNCGAATLTYSRASGSSFAVGTTTVNVTATDAAGNTRTGSFTVTVRDVTAPVVHTRTLNVSLVNGVASITAAQINNGSSDACGIASLSLSRSSFSCANLGANTVTLTATDVNGNTASATATVNVTMSGSAVNPAIIVTRSSNVYTGGPNNTIYLGYGAQSATLTASGGVSYRWSPAISLSNVNAANPVFAPTQEGTYTYTVTATNQYGCTGTATVTLMVINVRSSTTKTKVMICHNGNEITVSSSAVPAHLNGHGDNLGECVPSQGCHRDMTSGADQGLDMPQTEAQAVAAATPAAISQQVVLEAFPNPLTTATTVHFRAVETAPAQVRVFDQMGKLVATLFDEVAEGGRDYSLLLNAEKLATGLYMCQFISQGKVQTQRLTVVK